MKIILEGVKVTRIKELREALGIKQEELAILCNVTQSTISLWEIGKTVPRKKALEKLAERFGVSAGYILGIDDTCPVPDIADIDYVLSCEIRDMTEAEKQDVLDYVRFKHQQKAKEARQ